MYLRSLPRNRDSSIVALCVFGRGVFTGPLPSKALAIQVKIQFCLIYVSHLEADTGVRK
jgi:hypothetical protein